MKRFVWRLQRVLDVKAKEEQTKTAELLAITEKLAQTQGELLMQERILKNIVDSLAMQVSRKGRLVAGRGQLGEQEFFLRCSATSDELIKKLKDKVRELELRQREKIAEVLKIRRFKKGLEKLRAEAKRRFIKEQEKLEQKESDETATISFARKMTELDNIGNPIG
jgi:flagellar FliJ protein